MVIDTSVIIQIIERETGWLASLTLLKQQNARYISAASMIEVQAVLSRDQTVSAKEALKRLDAFIVKADIQVVALTQGQSQIAREAYLKYGKGQGHKASLNYGDAMSYALAKDTGEKLAFVGDDFQHTDLKVLRLPL